jgi:hypothetical protein
MQPDVTLGGTWASPGRALDGLERQIEPRGDTHYAAEIHSADASPCVVSDSIRRAGIASSSGC